MTSINEAPRPGTGAPRKTCSSERAEPFPITKSPLDLQLVDAGDLDACIDAAEAYERALVRKQYSLRKFTLNLKAYRDALDDLGRAVWTGVRP